MLGGVSECLIGSRGGFYEHSNMDHPSRGSRAEKHERQVRMTLHSSVGDELSSMSIIEFANNNLMRSIKALEQAMCQLEHGDLRAGAEVQKAIAEMRKAQDTALKERLKLDDERRKLEQATSDGAIDFDAARASILDSLDRVRRSRDPDPILE